MKITDDMYEAFTRAYDNAGRHSRGVFAGLEAVFALIESSPVASVPSVPRGVRPAEAGRGAMKVTDDMIGAFRATPIPPGWRGNELLRMQLQAVLEVVERDTCIGPIGEFHVRAVLDDQGRPRLLVQHPGSDR